MSEVITYSSAGGVVVDGDRVLLVRKRRVAEVRLPKGHIEPGEGRREAAVRETIEETGYTGLPVADLGVEVVRFTKEGRQVIRFESYYLMSLTSTERAPRSKEDEAKFEPFWAPLDEAEALLTFPGEQEFLRRARAALNARE